MHSLEGYETNNHQVSGVYVETYIVLSNVQLKAWRQLKSRAIVVPKFDSSARVHNWVERRTIPVLNSILTHINIVRHLSTLSNSVLLVSQLYSLTVVALHSDRYSRIGRSSINIEVDTRQLEIWNQSRTETSFSRAFWYILEINLAILNEI